jgi:hypothetical protein
MLSAHVKLVTAELTKRAQTAKTSPTLFNEVLGEWVKRSVANGILACVFDSKSDVNVMQLLLHTARARTLTRRRRKM